MGLNIKNEAVVERVRQLASARGVSLTEAVDRAVTRDLSDATGEAERELAERRARIDATLARIRSQITIPKGVDLSDTSDLYDDDGLPK